MNLMELPDDETIAFSTPAAVSNNIAGERPSGGLGVIW